jgi:hypothetical protein
MQSILANKIAKERSRLSRDHGNSGNVTRAKLLKAFLRIVIKRRGPVFQEALD